MATLASRLSDLATAIATAIKRDRTWINNNAADMSGLKTTSKNLLGAANELYDSRAGKQNTLTYTPENQANKNANNGYAGLGADGKVPAALLPSYVDDVLEYANLAAFPATGETGKLYVAMDTDKTYRWSGSGYRIIMASPGSTDNVTEGNVNLYFTAARAIAATQTLTGDTDQNLVTIFNNGLA